MGKRKWKCICRLILSTLICALVFKNVEGFKENGAKLLNNGPYVLAKLAGLKADDAFIDWATISGWALGYDVINKEWSERQMEL